MVDFFDVARSIANVSHAARDARQPEIDRTRKALEAALGYLLNAKIDLETGAPKETALNTIKGGIATIRAALGAGS